MKLCTREIHIISSTMLLTLDKYTIGPIHGFAIVHSILVVNCINAITSLYPSLGVISPTPRVSLHVLAEIRQVRHLRQLLPEHSTVVDRSTQANQINQARDTVKTAELLVESDHLLGMGGRIIALLAVASFWHPSSAEDASGLVASSKSWQNLTLVLPLAHDIDRHRTQDGQVDEAGDGDGGHGKKRAPVLGLQKTGDAMQLARPAGRQRNDDGQRGLEREVDGESGRLELRELRPRQGFECDDARHERLSRQLSVSLVGAMVAAAACACLPGRSAHPKGCRSCTP